MTFGYNKDEALFCQGRFLGPVLSRQGLKDMGNSYDARLNGNSVTVEFPRITATVKFLMVRNRIFRYMGKFLEKGNCLILDVRVF